MLFQTLLDQERLEVPLHKYEGYFEKDVIPLSVFVRVVLLKAWKTLRVLMMKCFLFHGRIPLPLRKFFQKFIQQMKQETFLIKSDNMIIIPKQPPKSSYKRGLIQSAVWRLIKFLFSLWFDNVDKKVSDCTIIMKDIDSATKPDANVENTSVCVKEADVALGYYGFSNQIILHSWREAISSWYLLLHFDLFGTWLYDEDVLEWC